MRLNRETACAREQERVGPPAKGNVQEQACKNLWQELVANYKGELNVTITSAAPLPKDIQTRLETLLKQSQAAQQAKSLKITNKVCSACYIVLNGLILNADVTLLRSTLRFSVVSSSTLVTRPLT